MLFKRIKTLFSIFFTDLSRDIGPAVSALLAARVFAEAERERVDAYIRPIFDTYKFTYAAKWKDRHAGELLKAPKDLYLADDEIQVACFYDECDKAHRAHGFTGPQGHCPALIAEHLVIRAEWALIELAAPKFGINTEYLYGELREKFLELVTGAAVKAGNVRNLFKREAAQHGTA